MDTLPAPPNPALIARSVLVSKDTVLDTAQMQRLSLVYDDILIWMPLARRELTPDENARIEDDAAFLVEQGIASRCRVSTSPEVQTVRFAAGQAMPGEPEGEVRIPAQLLPRLPLQRNTDQEIRLFSRFLADTDTRAPVVAHCLDGAHLQDGSQPFNCLEIVLKQVPELPDGVPWQDAIEFRNEADTQDYRRELRVLMQDMATGGLHPAAMEEKIRAFMARYERYMALQHKKFGRGVVGILWTAAKEFVEAAGNLKLGSALRTLVEIGSRRVELTEAELIAPGREVAYIVKAQEFVKRAG